ncbi:Nuclear transport factor 2 domain [Dillenia turbinata]|uniref:Nuclear transport factor 2 domain n=1 Tax=Dillenia turbinata TaxID=194707 RepID=A0AAN8W0T6_9MAGN
MAPVQQTAAKTRADVAISEKLLSLNYQKLRTEVNTIDSQESKDGGLIVVVTGCLTGENNVRKRFVQSFFLAPQSEDEPSLDNSQNPMEIKTMDTQLSVGGGLFVLATGFLTGRDKVRRSFAQSSFHAPQQTPQGFDLGFDLKFDLGFDFLLDC